MKKTNIYLYKKQQQEKTDIFLHNKPTENYFKLLKNIPQENKIIIFDKTHQKTEQAQQKMPVKNHINKTGEHPLIPPPEPDPIFIDITKAYTQKKEGITTTCLGKRYDQEKNKHKNPSTFLCAAVAVLCSQGHTKIEAWLVNKL